MKTKAQAQAELDEMRTAWAAKRSNRVFDWIHEALETPKEYLEQKLVWDKVDKAVPMLDSWAAKMERLWARLGQGQPFPKSTPEEDANFRQRMEEFERREFTAIFHPIYLIVIVLDKALAVLWRVTEWRYKRLARRFPPGYGSRRPPREDH